MLVARDLNLLRIGGSSVGDAEFRTWGGLRTLGQLRERQLTIELFLPKRSTIEYGLVLSVFVLRARRRPYKS